MFGSSIQAKEYKEEKEEERELMGKIKAKMDIIRANQRKTIDSVDYKPKHHYQGNPLRLARRRPERQFLSISITNQFITFQSSISLSLICL